MTWLRVGLAVLVAGTAHAATLRVRCEKVVAPARSIVAVEAGDVEPGRYRARIISGANQALSDPADARGGVRLWFDSEREDIVRGVNPIPETFIRGGTVTGQLLDADGEIVAQARVACPQR